MSSIEENINEDDLLEKFFENMTFDEINNTSLSFACEIENFELVRYLVEKGESINYFCTVDDGWCGCNGHPECGRRHIPLLIAISKNNIEITKYLINNGADIRKTQSLYVSGFSGFGCLNIMHSEYFEMLKYLDEIDFGLDNEELNFLLKLKSKEQSDLLREELIAKYHSPENIEQWSVYYNKPFDEVIEIM